MAVIENRSTEIGDVILIKAEAPVVGLIALSSFADNTTGETGARLFRKEFRYSIDGTNFSLWEELTLSNIQAVQVSSTDTFFVEYRYIREGTDATGELQFDNITLTGSFVDRSCGVAYDNSIFAKYFRCNDLCVLNWAINVTQKLYDRGIIPEYISRNETNSLSEDQDYLEFWRSIAVFFAYIVCLGRVFENFDSNLELATQFVLQQGFYLCGEEDLVEILVIINNLLREKAKRGSVGMYDGDSDATGELLRLFCWTEQEFFILGVAQPQFISWNLNNSSPIYRGTTGRLDLNISYESTENVVDLNLYPLINTSDISIVTDGQREVIQIDQVAIGGISGIGQSDLTKKIVIDPELTYEITFEVEAESTANILSFGCLGFDVAGNAVPFISANTQLNSNFFFVRGGLNQSNRYYFIRGLLYKHDSPLDSSNLNIGFGQNLIFRSNINSIIPYITLDNTLEGVVSGSINIYNVKITPAELSYPRCFLNNQRFIDIFSKNNNGALEESQIDSTLRKSFIPYNTSFQVEYI